MIRGSGMDREALRRLARVTASIAFAGGLLALPASAACPPQIGTDAERLAAPDLRAAIAAANTSLSNPEGALWRVQSGDAPASYLIGTFHLPIGGVEVPTPEVERIVRGARLVMVELTRQDLQQQLEAAMAADPGLVMQFDKPPISALLTPDEVAMAEKTLAEFGLSLGIVDRFRPWAVFLLTALPPCVALDLVASQTLGLDERIAALARAEGTEVRSLETFLELVDDLDPDTPGQIRSMLMATLAMAEGVEMRLHDSRVLYSASRIAAIWELGKIDLMASGLDDAETILSYFWDVVVTGRNARMLARALPEIAGGNVVVAVGALHLPGEEGLVDRLRAEGYTVTRIDE